MSLNVITLNNCRPTFAGAVTEMCRVLELPGPTLALVKPSKAWALIYSGQSLDGHLDMTKTAEKKIEVVRLWSDRPYYYGSFCPKDAVCWCLSTPVKFCSRKDLVHHGVMATLESLRKLGINAFVRGAGFPAIEVDGVDKILSAPPAAVQHGTWYSTYSILWWDVSVDDIRVFTKASNPCIMTYDKENSGFAGIKDVSAFVDIDSWAALFSSVLAARLGLKEVPYSLEAKDHGRLESLAQKLSSVDWIKNDIHPEIEK